MPRRMGEAIKPINAHTSPRIRHTNCFLITAITPSISAIGTKTGDRKNILISPNMKDAIPNELLVLFCSITVVVVPADFSKSFAILIPLFDYEAKKGGLIEPNVTVRGGAASERETKPPNFDTNETSKPPTGGASL
jgi:hypothetical protein